MLCEDAGDLVLVYGSQGEGEDEGGQDGEEGSMPISPSYLSGFTNRKGESTWRFGEAGKRGGPAGGKAPELHVVTSEEEADRRYSIFDVVLPVVDSEVRCVLPKNSVRKFVKKLVKKDGMGDLLKSSENATQARHVSARGERRGREGSQTGRQADRQTDT